MGVSSAASGARSVASGARSMVGGAASSAQSAAVSAAAGAQLAASKATNLVKRKVGGSGSKEGYQPKVGEAGSAADGEASQSVADLPWPDVFDILADNLGGTAIDFALIMSDENTLGKTSFANKAMRGFGRAEVINAETDFDALKPKGIVQNSLGVSCRKGLKP